MLTKSWLQKLKLCGPSWWWDICHISVSHRDRCSTSSDRVDLYM